jgi:hypothetical protein
MCEIYSYDKTIISQILRRMRNLKIFFFLFFVPLPSLAVISALVKQSDGILFGYAVMISFWGMGLFFYRLSARIGSFTLEHKDDVIELRDNSVTLKSPGLVPVTIDSLKDIKVLYSYYAAGQAIFCLRSTHKYKFFQQICFTTDLNNFEKLIKTIDTAFIWPPESFK